MEDLSLAEMKRCIESLIEVTACAVCLDTVRPDKVQCVNKHIFCSICVECLNKCPTCKENFSEDKPSGLISQVFEAFPLRCKYKDCGKYLHKNDDHEKFCGFQIYECKMEFCEWTGPVQSILEHMKKDHPYGILSENSYVVIEDFRLDNDFTEHKFVSAQGHWFWLKIYYCASNELPFLRQRIYYIPNGKLERGLIVKVKSSGNSVKFGCKFKLEVNEDASKLANYFDIPGFMLSGMIHNGSFICKLAIKSLM